jgi:hypothetical protein
MNLPNILIGLGIVIFLGAIVTYYTQNYTNNKKVSEKEGPENTDTNSQKLIMTKEKLTVSDGFRFGFGFGAGIFLWGILISTSSLLMFGLIFKIFIDNFLKDTPDSLIIKSLIGF